MKVILLSDMHLTETTPVCRKDNAFKTGLYKFDFIIEYAIKHDIKLILQSGDLFDKERSWPLLSAMTKRMTRLKNNNISIYTISGQHDQYFRTDLDTTKSILEISQNGVVVKLGRFPERLEVDIYGASWNENIPKVDRKNHENWLVVHAPISDSHHNFSYSNADKFLKDNPDFDLILCGDIHRRFVVEDNGRFLINTGPMLRLEASEYNLSFAPKFCVFENKSIEWVGIPYDKNVLTTEHVEATKEKIIKMETFMASLKEVALQKPSFKNNLKGYLDKNKELKSGIIELIGKYIEFKK